MHAASVTATCDMHRNQEPALPNPLIKACLCHAAAPVPRKKRGPYKKRIKPEGEQAAAPKRRKGASSLMPALEMFASRVKQEKQDRQAGAGQQGWEAPLPQQGPSKKPR